MSKVQNVFTLSILATGVACGGGYAVPDDRLIPSHAAVRGAEDAGARNEPQAALRMQLAPEQVSQATSFIGAGEDKRADYGVCARRRRPRSR